MLESFGYSVHRWPVNRFDGMRDALVLLQGRGYLPRLIIDCGANMGAWTRMARSVFPEAAVHVIEPQPACRGALERLARQAGGITVHELAVTEAGITRVRIVGARGGGTGAYVAQSGECETGELERPATTLDALFADQVTSQERTLLKLDLEGHELAALRGGIGLLEVAEVVLTEVQFFEINDNGRPRFTDILDFLQQRGFQLCDVACLSSRPRDLRLCMGDLIFAHRNSPLLADRSWE